MTTKIKATLLTALFFFGLLTGLQAQDKYDFAMVYICETNKICIIENDQVDKIIDPQKKLSDGKGISERLLNQVSKMTEQGWEVITVTTYGQIYLKRKKQ